jgi:secondary thiamine-phosphate synthase enzyme
MWLSRTIEIAAVPRGLHLITGELLSAVPEASGLDAGLLHAQILHTSAALTLNENADPSVGVDLASWLDRIAPENAEYWTHTLEGPDDMPAHAKAALLGPSVTIPIADGRPVLGTWQGIHLAEFRDRPSPRRISLTLAGE